MFPIEDNKEIVNDSTFMAPVGGGSGGGSVDNDDMNETVDIVDPFGTYGWGFWLWKCW